MQVVPVELRKVARVRQVKIEWWPPHRKRRLGGVPPYGLRVSRRLLGNRLRYPSNPRHGPNVDGRRPARRIHLPTQRLGSDLGKQALHEAQSRKGARSRASPAARLVQPPRNANQKASCRVPLRARTNPDSSCQSCITVHLSPGSSGGKWLRQCLRRARNPCVSSAPEAVHITSQNESDLPGPDSLRAVPGGACGLDEPAPNSPRTPDSRRPATIACRHGPLRLVLLPPRR